MSAPCINLKQRIGRELIDGLVFLNGPYYSSTDKERRKKIEYPMCERSLCGAKDILIMGNRNFYSFLVFVIRILDDGSQMIAECGMEKDLN